MKLSISKKILLLTLNLFLLSGSLKGAIVTLSKETLASARTNAYLDVLEGVSKTNNFLCSTAARYDKENSGQDLLWAAKAISRGYPSSLTTGVGFLSDSSLNKIVADMRSLNKLCEWENSKEITYASTALEHFQKGRKYFKSIFSSNSDVQINLCTAQNFLRMIEAYFRKIEEHIRDKCTKIFQKSAHALVWLLLSPTITESDTLFLKPGIGEAIISIARGPDLLNKILRVYLLQGDIFNEIYNKGTDGISFPFGTNKDTCKSRTELLVTNLQFVTLAQGLEYALTLLNNCEKLEAPAIVTALKKEVATERKKAAHEQDRLTMCLRLVCQKLTTAELELLMDPIVDAEDIFRPILEARGPVAAAPVRDESKEEKKEAHE